MHWEPRVVLWTMNVEQLVWWWTQAWALQNRLRGVDPEAKFVKGGDSPDKAAIRAQYGSGSVMRG